MCVSCRGNMRDTDGGRTTDRPLLLHGKIFSHMNGTGSVANVNYSHNGNILYPENSLSKFTMILHLCLTEGIYC